ncbi:MAG: hypothetical protein IPN42_12470 [Methylococcaceae bacterium]|nr:hypothetical protein [Methylococcaceae bacterium]
MKNVKLFVLAGILAVGKIQANELDDELKEATGKAEVSEAESTELKAFKDRIISMLQGKKVADWNSIDFEQKHHKDYETLQEQEKSKNGRGYFAVNLNSKNNWLLQAPHADSDLHTGKIASRLFLTDTFKAAQWNTVHRDISDMAHTPDTYWQAFTQAFAEQYPEGKIVQIHGYDQQSRKTASGSDSDMILSAGHENPPQWIHQTVRCLKDTLPFHVGLYPYDVKELGGTQNVQGQMLRTMGFDGFLHIEMSKAMRVELLNNEQTRKRFIGCL